MPGCERCRGGREHFQAGQRTFTNTSLPSKMGGIASACTGVVNWYFITSASAFFVLADTSRLAKATVGPAVAVLSLIATAGISAGAATAAAAAAAAAVGAAAAAAADGAGSRCCFFTKVILMGSGSDSNAGSDSEHSYSGFSDKGFGDDNGFGLMRFSSDNFRPALGGGGSTAAVTNRIADVRHVGSTACQVWPRMARVRAARANGFDM